MYSFEKKATLFIAECVYAYTGTVVAGREFLNWLSRILA